MILFRIRWRLVIVLTLVVLVISNACAQDEKEEPEAERYKWFLTAYAGAHAQDDFQDVVTFQPTFEDNAYIGGVIAPGLDVMTDYLHDRTALLPHIDIREPAEVIDIIRGAGSITEVRPAPFYGPDGERHNTRKPTPTIRPRGSRW